MKQIETAARDIVTYLTYTGARGSGRTTLMAKGACAMPHAVVVGQSINVTKNVLAHYGLENHKKLSIIQIANGALRGMDGSAPLAIDHTAMMMLLSGLLAEIDKLRD
jgi:hypothetical protein